jgi:hypothetical protein
MALTNVPVIGGLTVQASPTSPATIRTVNCDVHIGSDGGGVPCRAYFYARGGYPIGTDQITVREPVRVLIASGPRADIGAWGPAAALLVPQVDVT